MASAKGDVLAPAGLAASPLSRNLPAFEMYSTAENLFYAIEKKTLIATRLVADTISRGVANRIVGLNLAARGAGGVSGRSKFV
jgi:hypothetical protein